MTDWERVSKLLFIRLALEKPRTAFFHGNRLFITRPGFWPLSMEIPESLMGFAYQGINFMHQDIQEEAEIGPEELMARLEAECSERSFEAGARKGDVKTITEVLSGKNLYRAVMGEEE